MLADWQTPRHLPESKPIKGPFKTTHYFNLLQYAYPHGLKLAGTQEKNTAPNLTN